MGVNPGEGVVRAKAGAQVTGVNPVDGAEGIKTEPWFKPKNAGSLILPKRKLVKKMMWDYIVHTIASCFYPITNPAVCSSELTLPIKHTCNKKKKKISPA